MVWYLISVLLPYPDTYTWYDKQIYRVLASPHNQGLTLLSFHDLYIFSGQPFFLQYILANTPFSLSSSALIGQRVCTHLRETDLVNWSIKSWRWKLWGKFFTWLSGMLWVFLQTGQVMWWQSSCLDAQSWQRVFPISYINLKKKHKYTICIYLSRCGQLASAGAVKIRILKHFAAFSLVPLRRRRKRRRKTTSTNLNGPWLSPLA